MKKILKLAIIPAAFLIAITTTGCNAANKEVALITDVGDIDDGSFNQAAWEAIKGYCSENNRTYDYYRPFADSDFARKCAVKQAVYKGAKIVVCPGFKFAATVNQCQQDYPDVHFVLIDSDTGGDVLNNTVCIGYLPEVSGFLAGAAVAYDYLTYDLSKNKKIDDVYKYGYCGGMASDGVLQFGFGFIQGVVCGTKHFLDDHKIMEPNYPELDFRYHYAGVFAQSDPAAIKMKGWYGENYKAIFACGGKLYQSVTEGVKDYNRKNNLYDFEEGNAPRDAARWIGVDSDQYVGLRDEHEKKTIITSALKGLNPSITTALKYHFADAWDVIGGPFSAESKSWKLGINSYFGREDVAKQHSLTVEPLDYVGIPDAHDESTGIMRGFNNFTYEQYQVNIQEIKEGNQIVYGGDSTDLISDGETKVTPTTGNPSFINEASHWSYIPKGWVGTPINYGKICLKDYPQAQIKVQVID